MQEEVVAVELEEVPVEPEEPEELEELEEEPEQEPQPPPLPPRTRMVSLLHALRPGSAATGHENPPARREAPRHRPRPPAVGATG